MAAMNRSTGTASTTRLAAAASIPATSATSATRQALVRLSASTRLDADDPGSIVEVAAKDRITRMPGGDVAVGDAAGVAQVGQVGRSTGDGRGPVTFEIVVDGWRFELEVEDAVRVRLRDRATRPSDARASSGPTRIQAIIPGRVAAVQVVVGDAVTAGQSLMIVEAMKMQNEVRAPRDGTVGVVAVAVGQTIDAGDLLVVLT